MNLILKCSIQTQCLMLSTLVSWVIRYLDDMPSQYLKLMWPFQKSLQLSGID